MSILNKGGNFYDAIIAKKISTLKELCEKHKNYINYYYNGKTPLHVSILYRFNEGMIELLSNGANPNLPCRKLSNETALEFALDKFFVNTSLIRLLGFYGANPPSNNNLFKTNETKEAYKQGRDVFIKKESIQKLIELESSPLFKAHYIEIANIKKLANVSSEPKLTETLPLLRYHIH